MVIGHFGVAFAAKKVSPQVSLGTFFMATIWLDLIWPIFLLLGVEQVKIVPGLTKMMPLDFYYPYSHSLSATLIWGLLFGVIHFALRRSWLAAITLAVCVVSHWFLDWVVHRPDLPLTLSNEYKLGLGLWNFPMTTLVIEGSIFVVGLAFYWLSSSAKNIVGLWSLIFLIGLLLAIYSTQFIGVMPPNEQSIAYVGLAQWLLVALGYWVDRNRLSVSS